MPLKQLAENRPWLLAGAGTTNKLGSALLNPLDDEPIHYGCENNIYKIIHKDEHLLDSALTPLSPVSCLHLCCCHSPARAPWEGSGNQPGLYREPRLFTPPESLPYLVSPAFPWGTCQVSTLSVFKPLWSPAQTDLAQPQPGKPSWPALPPGPPHHTWERADKYTVNRGTP